MEDSVLQRIRKIINEYHLSDSRFADTINLPRTTISSLFNRGNEPNVSILRAILDAYTSISPEWLITGKGPMLKSECLSTIKQRLDHFLAESKINPDEFCKAIDVSGLYFQELRGTIPDDKLKKIRELYPSLSIEWLMIGEGNMLRSESISIQTIDSANRIKELEEENKALEAEINQLKGENKILRELIELGIRKDSNKSA